MIGSGTKMAFALTGTWIALVTQIIGTDNCRLRLSLGRAEGATS